MNYKILISVFLVAAVGILQAVAVSTIPLGAGHWFRSYDLSAGDLRLPDPQQDSSTANECTEALGMEDGRITDGQISASSEYDSNHAAKYGRLNHSEGAGAWSAKANDGNQWLQVDFGALTKVTGIETQGRVDYSQWVTQYTVSYSVDGSSFQDYKQDGQVTVFHGNSDPTTVMQNQLNVLARYVRIKPTEWHSFISMRVEFQGCPAECTEALGMEDGRITDGQISASSEYDSEHAAKYGRLNHSDGAGAWSAKTNDGNQWLQVDFGALTKVTGIETQGRVKNYEQWVNQYTVSYSVDGSSFEDYQQNGEVKVFDGNSDPTTVVQNQLSPSVYARYVRIKPTKWKDQISMRVEFLGCPAVCTGALGMEDGRITDGQISASSFYGPDSAPKYGRLNHSDGQGAWIAEMNDQNQWLQVDFDALTKVTAIETQGRIKNNQQWVTHYTVSYSVDNVNFEDYKQNGEVKVFDGNSDPTTVVTNQLSPNVYARYVRIKPTNWQGTIAMRVEFRGCHSAECSAPLGMEDGRIKDGQISASSYYGPDSAPKYGRLNHSAGQGAWVAKTNNENQWIQVNFGALTKVTGIETQGRVITYHQWVTQYTVSYSVDGKSFEDYKRGGEVKVFDGNSDPTTVVKNELIPNAVARYVRIKPKKWQVHIAMRIEFLGCPAECNAPLGMEDGRITDGQISASSYYGPDSVPKYGRLNHSAGQGAWVSRTNNENQWIQVDLKVLTKVTGIETQGRVINFHEWVTKYTVSYSADGSYFEDYKQNGEVKVFDGNSDPTTVVENQLIPSVYARYIRIKPTSWDGAIAMRLELLGCFSG